DRRWGDAKRPLGLRRFRRKAGRVVTRLIAELRRHRQLAFRCRTRHRELHADREGAFETRKRLSAADLREIDWSGEDYFFDRHAFWRIDGQDGCDEVGI